MRTVRSLAAAAAVAIAVAGCGVPADESARPVRPEDVPFGLLDPAPSQTTTSVPRPADVTTVFLIRDERLVPVEREVGREAGPAAALAALERGASDAEATQGLRSAVPSEGVSGVERDGDTAVVDLAGAFASLDPGEQLLAIAQIVYTATAQPGVVSVAFQLDGRPVEVPTDGASLAATPVTRDDYRSLAPR